MTADVVSRAFDPFFTTKPTGSGTGLGLSMVYGFVSQSGGQVRIDSAPDEGATITLMLPRFTGEPERAAHAETDHANIGGRGETVALVDDEDIIRLLIGDALREAGYTVVEAGNGADGLELLQASGRIDLLITDVGLPGGMNGRQLADAARVHRPALKVLFITGYAESAVLTGDQLQPGMQVMTKPFAIDALSGLVRTIIDS
jgi:CheY-like chemotaxis protein